MIPARVLLKVVDRAGTELVPRWFGERDHGWLRALLDEHARHVGQRRAELAQRLSEPLSVRAPKAKLDLAVTVLDGLSRTRVVSSVKPRAVRAAVFGAAARVGRSAAFEHAARELGVAEAELDVALFADLPTERRVRSLGSLSAADLADHANLALAAALLSRASVVHVRVRGDAGTMARRVRRLGLICTARGSDTALELSISGPFALFRRTELYGRALASLISEIGGLEHWELRATCVLPRLAGEWTLALRAEQRVLPRRECEISTAVVDRLARELGKLAPRWQVVRDPPPIDAGDALVFPDLELRHREDPARRWRIEVAGFWTRESIAARTALEHFILCVDGRRGCSDTALPHGAHVLRYGRRVDPRAVLALLDYG